MSKIGNSTGTGFQKMGVIRERKESPVKTTGDPKDTYDSFKGVNLGIIKIGKFQDADKSETTENILDKNGAAQLKKLVEQTSTFKDVKVDPNAVKITKTDEKETFKGIVFFNRWKMGKFNTGKETEASIQYQVYAKMPVAGGLADMKTKMSQVQPKKMETRTWVSLFGR